RNEASHVVVAELLQEAFGHHRHVGWHDGLDVGAGDRHTVVRRLHGDDGRILRVGDPGHDASVGQFDGGGAVRVGNLGVGVHDVVQQVVEIRPIRSGDVRTN